jgi:hypothetical protein
MRKLAIYPENDLITCGNIQTLGSVKVRIETLRGGPSIEKRTRIHHGVHPMDESEFSWRGFDFVRRAVFVQGTRLKNWAVGRSRGLVRR